MAKPKWLRGKYRWWILLTIIVGLVATHYVPPIQPHVQLPAEKLSHEPLFTIPGGGPIYLTNTLVALLLVDLVLLAVVFAVQRAVKSGEMVPRGLSGVIEAALEYLHNLTESSTAKWTGFIFPFFATIFLMVLVANWMELLPGVDSIGFLEPAAEHGYPVKEILPGVAFLVKGAVEHGEGFKLVPWVRVVPTDLNFTVGLALVSVFMTQVLGFKALGLSYLSKFFRFSALAEPFKVFSDPNEPRKVRRFFSAFFMGAIDFVVGLIELISEFSKILSFSFRLFGNIFAGSVMLFVMGTLLPVVQSFFLLFELFVGIIQAFIFGILTMLFMSLATQGHGGHEEHAHA
ncbi:MAG TPA: F0F1 ATP synthase subunit A [Anaerolineae bacterium]|nr:F0F1 ATP synthase subunit A [Anaerolineae bacterium]HID85483.1 F0F1 ATP synthase subunit A [Anaerolineales bacterium]HIQ07969.1 F0F1 ATP synthase subunit A [Anaerolineaceae bacterium]